MSVMSIRDSHHRAAHDAMLTGDPDTFVGEMAKYRSGFSLPASGLIALTSIS